jgi:DnaJ-domain-containing protein 1
LETFQQAAPISVHMDVNRRLLETLLDLHHENKSGILRVQKNGEKKQLVLSGGSLAFAESNVPQEHLARVMIGLGLLSRAKLNEVADSMKNGMTSEEAILAVSDAGSSGLEKGRREQAMQILGSITGWDDCELRFFSGDNLLRNQTKLGLALPEVIALSLRHAISRHALRLPANFMEGSISLPEDFAAKSQVFPLSAAEIETCSMLRYRMNVSYVLSLVPAGKEKPQEVLLFLYLLGLISLHKEALAETDTDVTAETLEETLARFSSASLYEILSVAPEATVDEIQNAYHEQAKQLHPDRFQSAEFSDVVRKNAERIFTLINEAYRTLRSPVFRTEYDQQRLAGKQKTVDQKTGVEKPAEAAASLFREGRALLAKGDVKTALERLKACVWLCPEKAVYNHYLGIAESKNPKLRKSAEQHLLRAIELEDLSADSHLALARLYIDVNLPRKAEQQLELVMLWDPNNAEAKKLSAELKTIR